MAELRPLPEITDTDVVIVGAGVAGLSAVIALRAAGLRTLILEASGRSGGRAFTDYPAVLGGTPFDHGASWLHDADANPLTPLIAAIGASLIDAATVRTRRSFLGDRLASAAEREQAVRAQACLAAHAAARALADGPDVSLAEALADRPPEAWMATFLAWEGAIIAAADADRVSVRDWHANALAGRNLSIAGGLGAAIIAALTPLAGTMLHDATVRRIAWQEAGGRVAVTSARGTVTAGAAIVTVATGVLAAGDIGFDPPLPQATAAAIDALPMGLLSKVALAARGADRLDLPPFCAIDYRLAEAGESAMFFHAWPFGHDYVVGFIGGRAAWHLARADTATIAEFARDRLAALLGGRARALFDPAHAVATRWGSDPHFRGAYCYAGPGDAYAREILARPLADGRLSFAGEACHVGHGGTVGGAFESGRRAAEALIARVTAQRVTP